MHSVAGAVDTARFEPLECGMWASPRSTGAGGMDQDMIDCTHWASVSVIPSLRDPQV